MKRLKEDIKNQQFARMYLLYGDEDFLKRTYRQRIKDAMVGDDEMNYAYYEGNSINWDEVEDVCNTLPFFAERKLIVIEDSGVFKTTNPILTRILENAPETTFFLFCEKELDKRNHNYKFIHEKGYDTELKILTDAELGRWLSIGFGADGLQIRQETMNYFLQKVGTELGMDYLDNEAHKLAAYVQGRASATGITAEQANTTGAAPALIEITPADIDAICITQTKDRVFDMLEAISAKDSDRAIRLYADLMNLKESPMRVLVLLCRQFVQMLAVKELMQDHSGSAQIAAQLGMRPFVVGKYVRQTSFFTAKELEDAIEECAGTEQAVKSGRMQDGYAVELLIVKYATRE